MIACWSGDIVPKKVDVDDADPSEEGVSPKRKRYTWAKLLARVFNVEITTCACGGRLKIVAAIVERSQVRRYLEHAGLSADPPIIAPARGPPVQLDFEN